MVHTGGFELAYYPGSIYLFKVNNRNTRKRCEICSKSTITTAERSIILCSHFKQLYASLVSSYPSQLLSVQKVKPPVVTRVYSLMDRMCTYQGVRNVSFSENFVNGLNE